MNTTVLTAAAGAAAVMSIWLAPVSAADPVCTNTGSAKHCSNPGNAQITSDPPSGGRWHACLYGAGFVCSPSIAWNIGGMSHRN